MPETPPTPTTGGPERVLFTGFPGFIGERLLPRLIEGRPGAEFVCVVQRRFAEAAARSRTAIEEIYPAARGRIRIAFGDITLPGLGLEAEVLSGLTAAYHLAAAYDLAVPREVGMRVNVEGTRNVLQFLAGAPWLERLHYVSTAYVSGTATGVFRETDLDVGQRFKNFYEETKFLAEVEVARSGLPSTIYRPAIVVGDSRTGETGKFDGPYFTLSAMERVPSPGVFLKVGWGRNPANLVPVDFIVDALAALSRGGAAGKTYHLTDPAPLSVSEVARLMASAMGKRFLLVPVPKAVAKVAFAPRAVQRYFGMPVQTLDYFDHPCRYDTTAATADLRAVGVSCPPFASYVGTMVAFYRAHREGVRREAMV
jgi:thioester reductase-like protein